MYLAAIMIKTQPRRIFGAGHVGKDLQTLIIFGLVGQIISVCRGA